MKDAMRHGIRLGEQPKIGGILLGRAREQVLGRHQAGLPAHITMRYRVLEAQQLDLEAHGRQVLEVLGRDWSDAKAALRLGDDQAFGREPGKRLANRTQADVEVSTQLVDDQALPGLQPAGQQVGPKAIVGRLCQARVLGHLHSRLGILMPPNLRDSAENKYIICQKSPKSRPGWGVKETE